MHTVNEIAVHKTRVQWGSFRPVHLNHSLFIMKESILYAKINSNLMSGSYHLDRASNVVIGVDPCEKRVNILAGQHRRNFFTTCSNLVTMAIYVVK